MAGWELDRPQGPPCGKEGRPVVDGSPVSREPESGFGCESSRFFNVGNEIKQTKPPKHYVVGQRKQDCGLLSPLF